MRSSGKIFGGAAAVLVLATLFITSCSNPVGSNTSPTAGSRSLNITLIADSNAKLADYVTNPEVLLPEGTTVPGFLKFDGQAVVVGQLGPLTITKLYYQQDGSNDVVGFDFFSEMPLIALYVKGGAVGQVTKTTVKQVGDKTITQTTTSTEAGGNLYTWSNDDTGNAETFTSGTEFSTAVNPANGLKSAISHIEFYWVPQVLVSVTAGASYDRNWSWAVTKTSDIQAIHPLNSPVVPLILDVGQSQPIAYTVDVTSRFADVNLQVAGVVSVRNPEYNLTEALISVAVNHGVVGTGSLLAGASQNFPYTLVPSLKADGSVTAAVTTAGNVAGASAAAPYTFGTPVVETDEAATVSDSLLGLSEVVTAPKSYAYTLDLKEYAAASITAVTNTALVTANDTLAVRSAETVAYVQLRPQAGYTRSQGYWRTHAQSVYQSRPVYDATWDKLGKDRTFFLSAQTYIGVMWNNTDGGNAYYQLARQYVGSKLNVLTGYPADPGVAAALSQAEVLFAKYTPAQMGSLKATAADRKAALAAAGVLGAFNIDRNAIR